MEKNRQIKMLFIVALVLSVTAMTLGFAAFSTTLNVSSSASVTPNSDDFKVRFTGIDGDNKLIITSSTVEATEGVISEDGQSISGISINFTKPGDYVIYKAYIDNVGEYDAYFYDVRSAERIEDRCVPIDDVDLDMLNAACSNIGYQFSFQSDDGTYAYNNDLSLNENYYLKKGSRHVMLIRYIYLPSAGYVDGAFKMNFVDSYLDYGTVPKS